MCRLKKVGFLFSQKSTGNSIKKTSPHLPPPPAHSIVAPVYVRGPSDASSGAQYPINLRPNIREKSQQPTEHLFSAMILIHQIWIPLPPAGLPYSHKDPGKLGTWI